MDFVNLHTHSIFSIRDAIAKIPDLVGKAKSLNQPGLCLTDHGNLGAAIKFNKECKDKELKPLFGVEVYMATRSRFQKESGIDKYFHLTLIAMNNTGWQNLCILVTESYKREHFYYKPRIDRELLRKYSEGLICLSGCMAGNLVNSILIDKKVKYVDEEGNTTLNDELIESPLDTINWYRSIFKDRYYLEIQNHYIEEESIARDVILNYSDKLKIKPVATGDSHFINEEDVVAHNIMLAIRDKKSIYDENFKGYPGSGYHLPDEKYIKERFSQCPEAADNTMEIYERCNVSLSFGNFKIPNVYDVRIVDNEFEKAVKKGLERRFNNQPIPDIYKQRLNEEIKTINQMTFSGYFLIVQDYIRQAKSLGIGVNYGRGSVAGSLAAYALGITEVDPIERNLSFARFLNKGRSAIPIINFPEYTLEDYKNDRVHETI